MKRLFQPVAVLGCALTMSLALADANGATVGINVINLQKLDPAAQNTTLSNLKMAGVTVIRTGITPDDKGIDLARRAYAQGIRIDLIVGVQFRPNAPTRPWQPKEFPHDWSEHPLSYADPEQARGSG
jgi:hypothetical protein